MSAKGQTVSDNIFNSSKILVLPSLIAKKRLSVFEMQVKKLGGVWCDAKAVKAGHQSVTYIVVEDSILRSKESLGKALQGFENASGVVVGTKWLSDCLRLGQLLPTESYCIRRDGGEKFGAGCTEHSSNDDECSPSKKLREEAQDKPVVEESGTGQMSLQPEIHKYACSQASSTVKEGVEENKVIITELQKLADAFRSKGDTWRAHGYSKAISAIKRCGKPISTYEDAVALPGVGDKIASKVWEILESGSLQKVSEVCCDEKTQCLELFTAVWGAGPSTAESWYQQGYRSLQDLEVKAALTKQQKIGLKHYEDFRDRIPREEVEEVGRIVAKVAASLEPQLKVELVGSYRRGKQSCGDIDIMICKPDHLKSQEILSGLLTELKNIGLITDDLVSVEASGDQHKYLGVCRLSGDNRKFRRLDIFVVPRSEMAAATMHYTGSALFNRSIRLLAAKKGMSLSEHSLHAGIVREGSTILNEGYIVPTPTEESIFQALGLDYLPPTERDH